MSKIDGVINETDKKELINELKKITNSLNKNDYSKVINKDNLNSSLNEVIEEINNIIKLQSEAYTEQKLQNTDYQGQISAISVSQAVIEFNMDGTIINANDNFLNVMGYKLDEIKGKHHSIFIEESNKNSQEYKDFWKKLNEGSYDDGVYKRIGKDGNNVWLQSSYNPIRDLNGKPFKVVKYATDITSQKLKDADYQGQIAAISVSQAVIEFNMDGTIINANDNFLKTMGYKLDEIKGQHHKIFVDENDKNSQQYKEFWQKLNEGKYDDGIYKRIGKDGNNVWLQSSYNPIRDLNGKPFKVVKYAADITKQKLKDMEISMIKAAHDNASVNIMMADKDFKIIYLNDSIKKMFKGYQNDIQKVFSRFDANNMLGVSIDLFHKEPAHQRNLLINLNGIHNQRIKIGNLGFDLNATKAQNESGEFLGYALEWIDITQQIIAEQKVSDLVGEILNGQLDKRINTEGLSGFLENIAKGLNNILNNINEPIMDIREVVTKIGEGVLNIETQNVYRGDFISIKQAIDDTLNNLNNVLGQTKSTVNEVSGAAIQIRAASHSVASSAQQQSSAVEESSSSLMQTANMVKANAENANIAKQLVSQTADAANDGQNKMKEMIISMDDIYRSSDDISKIIKVIDEIAFQTNLLALNAAVEAARAGKYGKGFAVVAQEVRNLAGRSAQAAKETSELIENSSKKVKQGVNITQSTADSLSQIVNNVIKVKDLVSEIASASDEQSKGINEVNKAIAQINQGTQVNSQQSIELASSSEELSKQTENLKKMIQQFTLRENKQLSEHKINLPEGVTVDMLNQIIKMLHTQNLDGIPKNGNNGSNYTNKEHSNQETLINPKKVLPLDEDERGYHGF